MKTLPEVAAVVSKVVDDVGVAVDYVGVVVVSSAVDDEIFAEVMQTNIATLHQTESHERSS